MLPPFPDNDFMLREATGGWNVVQSPISTGETGHIHVDHTHKSADALQLELKDLEKKHPPHFCSWSSHHSLLHGGCLPKFSPLSRWMKPKGKDTCSRSLWGRVNPLLLGLKMSPSGWSTQRHDSTSQLKGPPPTTRSEITDEDWWCLPSPKHRDTPVAPAAPL